MNNEKMNSKIKLPNNSSLVILIFVILKFRNIGRSTFFRSKFWPSPVGHIFHVPESIQIANWNASVIIANKNLTMVHIFCGFLLFSNSSNIIHTIFEGAHFAPARTLCPGPPYMKTLIYMKFFLHLDQKSWILNMFSNEILHCFYKLFGWLNERIYNHKQFQKKEFQNFTKILETQCVFKKTNQSHGNIKDFLIILGIFFLRIVLKKSIMFMQNQCS